MSVFIKGMEMPQDCAHCRFNGASGQIIALCDVAGWIKINDGCRADECPLAETQPYTDEQIQKMQDLHQAEVEKAFELGREDAKSECETGHWIPDRDCYSEMRFICSQCQKSEAVPTTRFVDYYKPIWNFCPHCGTRMWA